MGLSGNPGNRLIANTLFRGSGWCFSRFTMTRSTAVRADLIAGDTDGIERTTRHWTTKPQPWSAIRKLRAKSGQAFQFYDVQKCDFNALHLHYQSTVWPHILSLVFVIFLTCYHYCKVIKTFSYLIIYTLQHIYKDRSATEVHFKVLYSLRKRIWVVIKWQFCIKHLKPSLA